MGTRYFMRNGENMNTLLRPDIYLLMIIVFFFLGITTFIMGIFVLVGRAIVSKDIRTLTKQTAYIAQKGIKGNISGLVGNASVLIEALIQMVKTTAGIGIFLSITGLGLMAASYWLLTQVS